MSDLNIRDLYLAPPEAGIKECTVSGWVRTVRDSKAFGFIELNDGTCFKNLQIVLEDGHTRDFASAVKITLGSAIRVGITDSLFELLMKPLLPAYHAASPRYGWSCWWIPL